MAISQIPVAPAPDVDTPPRSRKAPALWAMARRHRVAIVVVVLLLLPLFISPSEQYDAMRWASTAIMALSVVVVTGASGQVTLGQAGLMAVGSYGAAITAVKLGLPQPLPLLVALVVTTIVGALLAFACLRLNGIYLAVVTLAFGWAVPELALKLDFMTDGYQGLFTEPITIAGIDLSSGLGGMYFAIIGLVVAFVLASNMLSNWSRLNVLAVKQSEVLAGSFGVVPSRQRVWAFLVSAFLAGLGGYVYTFTVGAVTPSSFSFDNSVAFLSAAVIGGIVSPIGALIGAAFVSLVPTLLAGNPEVASLIYGVLLFAAIALRGVLRRLPTLRRRASTDKEEGA